MSWPCDLRCAAPNFITCSTQNVTVSRPFIGRSLKMADALPMAARQLALCRTSFIADTSSDAVKRSMSRESPNPTWTIRAAFWGCSAKTGSATIGTPWYTASWSPPLPQCVTNRTVRGWPIMSFCGIHDNKCTFFGTFSGSVIFSQVLYFNSIVYGSWRNASMNLLNSVGGMLPISEPSDIRMTPSSGAVLTMFSIYAGRGRAGLALNGETWRVFGSDGCRIPRK